MRTINADDLKDLMYIACMGQDKAFVKVFELVIDDCPTIEPESLIPHGRWEEYIEFSDGQIGSYCSECHHGTAYFPQRPDRYCRGCGARMDKEG